MRSGDNRLLVPPASFMLREIAEYHRLFAHCGHCQSLREIQPMNVLYRVGSSERPRETDLRSLAPQLRCDSCDNRRGNYFSVEMRDRNY